MGVGISQCWLVIIDSSAVAYLLAGLLALVFFQMLMRHYAK